jgi:hypothetical protein
MVLEGVIGGVVSLREDWSPGAFSCPALTSEGICDRELGNEGLTNASLFVEVVVFLLIEPEVVIVALL